ncbi:MAG: hypothetical protein O2816_14660, partial [Planctomycetota bacterium]|nr:hypothetical protein [Planctomycetota bacterium]
LRLPISVKRAAKGAVPVVIAGAQVEPRPLSEQERRGGNQSATGTARSAQVSDQARELYRALCVNWPDELERQRAHWRAHLARTAHLECDDDPALERAFLWSKIAIERCWVNVDGVGRTLVAGLGPSYGGERPGFAWFFNGDALVATRALAALGDYAGCRDVFRFAASTQRADGKIAHEISLSAGLCDWFEDYPYAYYKGQQTPGFVNCLEHYVTISGDLELARELWPNVLRAVEWCLTTLDDQGRMQVPLAGIAAVEAGPLAGRIQTESYLQGIWCNAAFSVQFLAQRIGEPLPEGWEALGLQARRGLLTFWREDLGRFGFAHLDDGPCDDLSAYVALQLSRFQGQAAHLRSSLQQNRPEVMADWGARMFATTSEVYDPEHYNTGSVFPYLTNFSVLALFASGYPEAGWPVLRGQVDLDGIGGLGYLPEFLAGDRARLLPRSVPHQVFSQTTILQGVLFGLLDLVPEATGRLCTNVSLPPGMRRIALRGIAVGERRADLVVNRARQGDCEVLRLRLESSLGAVAFVPGVTLPRGSLPVIGVLRGDGLELSVQLEETGRSMRLVPTDGGLTGTTFEAEFLYRPGPTLDLVSPVVLDAPSYAPRLVDVVEREDGVAYTIAGPAGTTWNDLTFPPGEGFTETTLTLRRDDA